MEKLSKHSQNFIDLMDRWQLKFGKMAEEKKTATSKHLWLSRQAACMHLGRYFLMTMNAQTATRIDVKNFLADYFDFMEVLGERNTNDYTIAAIRYIIEKAV